MGLIRLSVAVDADQVELALAAFDLADIRGPAVEWRVVEPVEEPPGDVAWTDLEPADHADSAEVAAYLDDSAADQSASALRDALSRLWTDVDPPAATIEAVPDRDWRTAWHDYFDLVRIPGRCPIIIRPPHIAYDPKRGETVVDLAPGLAFGTGRHQSTRLCLALLAEHVRPDTELLDVGCGSGILAVAALKLGASHADAVDIDPLAVQAAQETAARNSVADRITVRQGSVPSDAAYPLVVANLTADLLQYLAPDLAATLSPDGVLIASGLIHTRIGEVSSVFAGVGLTVIDQRREGEWAALTFQREQPAGAAGGGSAAGVR